MGCEELLTQHSAPSQVCHGPLGKWLAIFGVLSGCWRGGGSHVMSGHMGTPRPLGFPYRFQIHPPILGRPLSPVGKGQPPLPTPVGRV